MATINPFDLLGDDDSDDISQLIAKVPVVQPVAKPVQPAVKSLAKNPSPNQAGRDFKSEASRGGGRGGSRGGGRGRGGGRNFSRDSGDGDNTFTRNNGYSGGYGGGAPEDGGGYGPPRSSGGGFRGGSGDGEAAEGERPRRNYERHSGTGYGNEFKREGSGRGNWGTPTDEIAPVTDLPLNEEEKVVENEKEDANKETSGTEAVKKEVEEKEMTLEEYEKVLEEKRQALLASKPEERKVVLDKEFKSMQLLSSKKNAEEIFAKLGADKDKKKEVTEKVKKAVSINDFLKPAQGEGYYRPGGRGRGGRGGGGGNYRSNNVAAPSIQDVGQFPLLGVK